jgi:hypothetical protein
MKNWGLWSNPLIKFKYWDRSEVTCIFSNKPSIYPKMFIYSTRLKTCPNCLVIDTDGTRLKPGILLLSKKGFDPSLLTVPVRLSVSSTWQASFKPEPFLVKSAPRRDFLLSYYFKKVKLKTRESWPTLCKLLIYGIDLL